MGKTKSDNKYRKLKIGIYSPYLDIVGGGERYILTIADCLSDYYQVDLFWDFSIRAKIKETLGITLEKVNFLSKDILKSKNTINKFAYLKKYDVFFYMTDGSLFFPSSSKNVLIIQSPAHIPSKTLVNRFKLRSWKTVCYSQFMRNIIKQKLAMDSEILSPCIDVKRFESDENKKENIILTVGRFFTFLHSKRQDLLAEVFKKNYDKFFKGWKLIIVGGLTDETGKQFIDKIKSESRNYPIEILINLPFEELVNLYKKAKLYWHAAGFGQDVKKFPEKAEHFGITTLEAMAAGTVPLAYNGGGQKDIIADGIDGYLWNDENDLVSKSFQLIKHRDLFTNLSSSARKRAGEFSRDEFYEKLEKIIS